MRSAIVALALLVPSAAAAQSRVEVAAGATWTGGIEAGGHDALLSRGTPGTPLTLFETSSRVRPAFGVAGRATLFLTGHFAAEATIEYSRPALVVTIANDFEQATGGEAANTLSSYVIAGSLVYRFSDSRLTPFVLGGAGHLRQLDEDDVMLVTALELHAGGGVRVRLTHHVALRADALISSRERSLQFEEKRQTIPVVRASIGYRF